MSSAAPSSAVQTSSSPLATVEELVGHCIKFFRQGKDDRGRLYLSKLVDALAKVSEFPEETFDGYMVRREVSGIGFVADLRLVGRART